MTGTSHVAFEWRVQGPSIDERCRVESWRHLSERQGVPFPDAWQTALRCTATDKFGIDLEVFKMKTGRKPPEWKKAVQIAGWIHIDEMRYASSLPLVA